MQTEWNRIQAAAQYIRAQCADFQPEVALIMGSGMGILAEAVKNPTIVDYQDIPHFPHSSVRGHAGKLVLGDLNGKNVVMMQGRVHYYEGHAMKEVVFPVRVMQQLGAQKLIVTNAAGGVNPNFRPGDLMLITDQLNFGFNNPFIGEIIPEYGSSFLDTRKSFSPELQLVAKEVAASQGITFKEGVYMFITGPSFETPAEIRMAQFMGGDAIGMSTVPEVLAAKQAGMQILGISYISNQAAGISPHQLSHQEVFDTMQKIRDTFIKVLSAIVAKI